MNYIFTNLLIIAGELVGLTYLYAMLRVRRLGSRPRGKILLSAQVRNASCP